MNVALWIVAGLLAVVLLVGSGSKSLFGNSWYVRE
jgi:hypothetical protein